MGVLWAVLWLAIVEIAVRRGVGPFEDWADEHDPSFWYGFSVPTPLCNAEGDALRCEPQEYIAIGAQQLPLDKHANAMRIVTLGGSHAHGSRAYTVQVVDRLTAACPNIRWESLNLGVRGFGTTRMRALMADAESYSPDIWVIDPGGSNEYEDERDLDYAWTLHSGPWRLFLQSHFVVLGRKIWLDGEEVQESEEKSGATSERVASLVEENQLRWGETQRRNLRSMVAAARRSNRPVVLMGRAYSDDKPDRWRQRNLDLLTDLGATDVPVVHSHEAFVGPDRKRLFARDRNHYSTHGHKKLASELAEVVLKLPGVEARCTD